MTKPTTSHKCRCNYCEVYVNRAKPPQPAGLHLTKQEVEAKVELFQTVKDNISWMGWRMPGDK